MQPDQRLSLFEAGAAGRPIDEAATQPIADLPLFAPTEDEVREAPAEHATQPIASRSAPASDEDRPAAVPVRRRLLASALDAAALLLTLGLLVAISLIMGVAVEWGDLPLYLPTWLAFGFFYQVLPLLFWGKTPGMTLIGIESRDRSGAPLTLKQATLRWLAGLVTWSLAGIPGTLAFTGRSLVDRASGSRTLPSR